MAEGRILLIGIDTLAANYSWKKTADGKYYRGGVELEIVSYGTKYNVYTKLTHPTNGVTNLTRKRITGKELEAILKNPRVHTDKGYIPDSPRKRLERAFESIKTHS